MKIVLALFIYKYEMQNIFIYFRAKVELIKEKQNVKPLYSDVNFNFLITFFLYL